MTKQTKFIPSKYQKDIYDFIENGKGNAVVNAVAGSGKTTTIVNALSKVSPRLDIIFLAFNKSIVAEIKTKVPDYVNVQTLHGVGWSSIIKTYRPQLNDRKVSTVLNSLTQLWGRDYDYGMKIKKLVDLMRSNLVTTPEELKILAEKHDIDIEEEEEENEIKRSFDVLKAINYNTKEFDYNDMIYRAATDTKVKMNKYDWIFIDECQDLNKAQQALIRKIQKPTSRFIAVGDPRQSIYGFCGSDIESFNNFANFPNTIQLPLSVNYRCGKNIIDMARAYVPYLEPHEGAIEGTVNEEASVKSIQDSDFVLCRNTAPLVQLCLEFIAQGKKAYVKGGDIGKDLINLVKKSKATQLKGLYSYLSKEIVKLTKRVKKDNPGISNEELESFSSIQLFKEKTNVLRTIGESNMEVKTTGDLILKIESIFKEESVGICLSTIHKSKGLEADNVFIIERSLMPSKWAKKAWQKEQEYNLIYVAYTRAKKQLNFVSDWSFKRKSKDEEPKTTFTEVKEVIKETFEREEGKIVEFADKVLEEEKLLLKRKVTMKELIEKEIN